MGLGKTLTMIALIATDLPGYQKDHLLSDSLTGTTTLVVVPPPRMSSWVYEEDKIFANGHSP